MLSQIGHHLVFNLAKWNAKNIVKQNLKAHIVDDLVEKISDNPNINWEEKNVEFELAGQMYDVIKSEEINHKLVYYCISDHKESSLLLLYNSCIQKNSKGHHQKNNKIELKYISIEGEFPNSTQKKNVFFTSFDFPIYFNSNLSSIYLKVEGRPPKHVA
jgi:hypothetical protein